MKLVTITYNFTGQEWDRYTRFFGESDIKMILEEYGLAKLDSLTLNYLKNLPEGWDDDMY